MDTPSLPTRSIAGVSVVDTPVVRAAQDYARAHSDELVFNHVMRSWLFGVIIYERLRAKGEIAPVDLEAHAVAALFHDLGWDPTGKLVSQGNRFEVDGANAAYEWLESQQKNGLTEHWDKHRLQLVWDAIAIHGVPSIARHKEPVVRLMSFGAGCDFQGPNTDRTQTLTWDDFGTIKDAFPRGDLAGGIRKIMCGLCRTKPEATWDTWVAAWGRNYIDGYAEKERLGFDGVEASVSQVAPRTPAAQYFTKEITLSTGSRPAGLKFPVTLAYWTFGSPSNPAVLLPSAFRGVLATTTPFLYSTANGNTDPPFPTDKFFVIVTSLLGAGESSSPSNTPAPWNGPNFPRISFEDNVVLQHALLTEKLGIKKLFAEVGFSLGGKQTYHMIARYPSFVENAVVIAAAARTSRHNWVFIEGPRHALVTARDFQGGNYTGYPKDGIKAFWRAYSAWALSAEWFRARTWETIGYNNVYEYLEENWTRDMDANDIVSQLDMWQKGDIAVYHPEDEGDLTKALGRIEARVLVMPSRTDEYFPPEDSKFEVKHLRRGEYRLIDSVWGHLAGGGWNTEDSEFIKREVKRFLGLD